MTNLMYALYDYVRSKEMPKYLLTDEYRQVQRAGEIGIPRPLSGALPTFSPRRK